MSAANEAKNPNEARTQRARSVENP